MSEANKRRARTHRNSTDECSAISEIAEQHASNVEALEHYGSFASHREKLTSVVLERLARSPDQRLCVLGAGNCFDLDVERVSQRCSEIHLVDLDEESLQRTKARFSPDVRAMLHLHAPIDLSGMLSKMRRWQGLDVRPEDLVMHAVAVPESIAAQVGGTFDCVVSTCVLTQMQLALVRALGDDHPVFAPAREILSLTHLRTLAALLNASGSALLVTDVASSRLTPAVSDPEEADPARLLSRLCAKGSIIYAANPDHLRWMVGEDSILSGMVDVSPPLDVWRWTNGPEHVFLVYALELMRRHPGISKI